MITYKSRRTGESISFDDEDHILSSTDMRGWKWDAATLNGSSRYSRGARDMKVTLTFGDVDEAQRFLALVEADTEAGVEATISITGWEIRGNISAGDFALMSVGGETGQYEVTFHSDYPVWRRELGKWSFPPSVQKNITLTNLVQNGDFSQGTTGWYPNGVTLSVEDGWMVGTLKTGFGGVVSIYQAMSTGDAPTIAGHKYYSRYQYDFQNTNTMRCGIEQVPDFYYTPSASSGIASNVITRNTTVPRNWVAGVASGSYTTGDKIKFRNPMLIDLTAAFCPGNEPTATEMDAMLAQFPGSWFDGTVSITSGLDYPHDYPFDYSAPPSGQKTITVDAIRPCDFELVAYGPVDNPFVTINGQRHQVNCSVPNGSLLFVNSLNAKRGEPGAAIFTRASDGTITNQYHAQDRVSDVFAPIQPGENLITWSGLFGFDLILYESRGVRPWT